MSEHVRQVPRRGKLIWVIDRVFKVVTADAAVKVGDRQRYRRDAEVQTSVAAQREHDRVAAYWLQHGNITALLVRPVAATKNSKAEAAVPKLTWAKLDEWYRETILPGLKQGTKRGYEEMLDSRFFLDWQQLPAESIDRATIDAWHAAIAKSNVGDSRTRNLHVVMRSVFRSAFEAKKIERLPNFPKLPKVGKKILHVAAPEDIDAILNEQDVGKWCGPVIVKRRRSARLAFMLSIWAGLRASEVRALRWPHLDLRRKVIVVRQASVGGVVDSPKSGADREIPIAPSLWAALEDPEVVARRERDPQGLVAPRIDGEPWGDSGLIQALGRACERLGIKGSRLHALRHFFVTTLFESGASAPEVQKLAGHSDLKTTQGYCHTTQERLRAAIDGLGKHQAARGNSVVTDPDKLA
jgi:integrase